MKTYIVANWKANKTDEEARSWIDELGRNLFETEILNEKEVVVCPPYTSLSMVRGYVVANNLKINVGAQDISNFLPGAYTGEVPASILGKDITYSIIGHSERRKNFGETDDILREKVLRAIESSITPIFCVQNENTPIPQEVKIVAYEPIEAIGTGNPDTPENASKIAMEIKKRNQNVEVVLYGGSVKDENVRSFTEKEGIGGVLVGGASLDPTSFLSIIRKC